jgi:hypothetical protein
MKHPTSFRLIPCLCMLTLSITSWSQQNKTHNNQLWLGYMTSGKLSQHYSIWNDVHYVPESFAIIRTGLTRHIFDGGSITAGYAFLKLPIGSSSALERTEHRPWGQLQFTLPAAPTWTLTQRIRYDARFKQNITDGEITPGYGFNHRVRFLFSIKKMLHRPEGETLLPYVVLSNETLLNFGREITYNTFDQNRLSLSFGLQKGKVQYQLGFMNRFVQSGPAKYTLNHTVVLWVIQKFDLQKVLHLHRDTEMTSE